MPEAEHAAGGEGNAIGRRTPPTEPAVEAVRPVPALRPLGPARDSERISALDTVRGFALLGIFLVNVFSFSDAFGAFAEAPEMTWGPEYWTHLFCNGKFYPLFSMLFGLGLVLQTSRAERSGRSVAGVYLRRQGVLIAIGFLHGTLLWYGDILFIYGFCGIIAFFFRKLRALTLALIAAGLFSFAVLLAMGMSLAMELKPDQEVQIPGGEIDPSAAPATPLTTPAPDAPPTNGRGGEEKALVPGTAAPLVNSKKLAIDRLHEEFWPARQFEFSDPLWMELEREAYREGPYRNALGFRFLSWRLLVSISVVSYGWHVIAMFFFGMALAKAGVFAAQNRVWRVRMALAGLLLGLPMAALATWAAVQYTAGAAVAGAFLLMVGGSLMSLGYLGGVALVVDSGRVAWATRAIANVGRMGLTNYLMQTVLATFVFYHWGLRQFASFSPAECVVLVFGIYAFQIVVSNLWMSRFRFGPVEWVWRTLTYLTPQPMVKNAGE